MENTQGMHRRDTHNHANEINPHSMQKYMEQRDERKELGNQKELYIAEEQGDSCQNGTVVKLGHFL